MTIEQVMLLLQWYIRNAEDAEDTEDFAAYVALTSVFMGIRDIQKGHYTFEALMAELGDNRATNME